MGARYLIDTNVAIGYLDNALPKSGLAFMDEIPKPILSVVTRIELLSWRNATKPQIAVLEGYINGAHVVGLSEDIVRNTIEIRKKQRTKLPDAIIAATALVYDFGLLTRNTLDFRGIAGLDLVNPWEV